MRNVWKNKTGYKIYKQPSDGIITLNFNFFSWYEALLVNLLIFFSYQVLLSSLEYYEWKHQIICQTRATEGVEEGWNKLKTSNWVTEDSWYQHRCDTPI